MSYAERVDRPEGPPNIMTDASMTLADFRQRFARMDRETRTAFVADLWGALGWETSTKDAVVVAERSDPVPETRRLLVRSGESPPRDPNVDAVVMPERPTDAGVSTIDAADMRDRALYGTDRSVTAQVFRRHFDRELTTDPTGDRPSRDRGETPAGGSTQGLDRPSDEPDEDAKPDGDAGPGDSTEPNETPTAGDASGGRRDESGRDSTAAWRGTHVLLIALVVAAGVGVAAGGGVVLPTLLAGDGPPTTPTATGIDETLTPPGAGTVTEASVSEENAVANGSVSRYASLRPTCERPPELVIRLQVGAFGRNDELDADGGIWTAYRFASPDIRATTGQGVSFARLIKQQYAIMLRYDSVQYGPPRRPENDSRTLTQRVTLRDGGTEAAFVWSVSKQEGGEYDGCWMTSSVRRVSAGEDTAGRNR